VLTHVTPASFDAGNDWSKGFEIKGSGPGAKTLECMGKENSGADQAQ
jgi:hypothetical protein